MRLTSVLLMQPFALADYRTVFGRLSLVIIDSLVITIYFVITFIIIRYTT